MNRGINFQQFEAIRSLYQSEIFTLLPIKDTGLKIPLAQVKSANISEYLLNEIQQIVYPFYQANETTRKVYKYIKNSIKL